MNSSFLKAYLEAPRIKKALKKRSWKSGFTLIELVIIVAILGILASIAVPAFTSAASSARRSATKTSLASGYKECMVARAMGDAAVTKSVIPTTGGGITYVEGSEVADMVATNVASTTSCVVYMGGVTSDGWTYYINLANGTKGMLCPGSPTGCTVRTSAWD